MIKKWYRKKPILISAYQADSDGYITTLEGIMNFRKGDYICTGIAGEKYPCKKEIFEAAYIEVIIDEGELA